MNTLIVRLMLLALLLFGGAASAHEMSMAEMQVREFSAGEYQWRWSASERKEPSRVLTPVWPAGCTAEADLLHCGPAGLQGTMSIRGVGDAYSAVLMKIYTSNYRWENNGLGLAIPVTEYKQGVLANGFKQLGN